MDKDLTVVGSGISALMSALFSTMAGYKARIVSQEGDPRDNMLGDGFSSTMGGEDSRYVTISEGHPYLGNGEYISPLYPDMKGAFQKPIQEGGWLSQPIQSFSDTDRRWLQQRNSENDKEQKIAELFQKYVIENQKSLFLWKDVFSKYPELVRDISLNDSGVLRAYGEHRILEESVNFHRFKGALIEKLEGDELAFKYPLFTESLEKGFIKGGVVVDGITFRVKKLAENIIGFLEENGAELIFSESIRNISRNVAGAVESLDSSSRKYVSRHYLLQLGAYDTFGLLGKLGCSQKISGVAGGWVTLPAPDGDFLPLKVHDGQHTVNGNLRPVVDLNINPATIEGKRYLIVGGGYLFVGQKPFSIPPDSRDLMMSEIHRVTELTLGEHYRKCLQAGEVVSSQRLCVRSFTPSDQELFEVFPANEGVVMVTGGGNTGTTAKAALIAKRVVSKIH